jgi:dTDP-4-dehydrorhamnose 3,5-epimerase
MTPIATAIADVKLLVPRVFEDSRVPFFESFSERVQAELGIVGSFVQDNQSFSYRDVVRGPHYQTKQPQGKLVRCLSGAIIDVAVDLCFNSSTFCKRVGETLSAANRHMLWIAPGFARGFMVLSDSSSLQGD